MREEACIGGATMAQPSILRLILNVAALAAADFALQTLIEGRAANTEHVPGLVLLRGHSSGR